MLSWAATSRARLTEQMAMTKQIPCKSRVTAKV